MEIKTSWTGWVHHESLESKQFICGYCGKDVGAHMGYRHSRDHHAKSYLCPNCGLPTLFYGEYQSPGPLIGREILGLPEDIKSVYKEMRSTIKNDDYTSTALLGRKLIMHIAVEAGAKEGDNFKSYIDFLAQKHYVPPKADRLLEFVRGLGNEKNHEIKLGTAEEAQKIIKFIESLLYFVYELESEYQTSAE